MKKKVKVSFALLVFALQFSSLAVSSQPIPSEPYRWESVQMVGGGFVDGIVFHPTAKRVCYCRTDMGGAYLRNPQTLRWEPLLDWLSYDDVNLMGIESIALDPSDPDRLYMACGTYTNSRTPNGAILRSADRGKTFQRTNVPFKMGGNEDGRGNGERMAVDPHDGSILYLGTRQAGLWRSLDKAVTWNRVESFPDITENTPDRSRDSVPRFMPRQAGCGIVFVLFDPQSGTTGKGCHILFAGVSLMNRENLFRSTDGGITWSPVTGHPTQYRPIHGVLASDGNLFITYGSSPGPSPMTNGGVWKYNTRSSEWSEITPDKPDPEKRGFGYAGLSVQADNPEVLIVSTFNRYGNKGGEDIYRSTDGGKSWKGVFASGGKYDYKKAPYIRYTGIHWLFDIEIDPFDPDHAMFTTGYGGHETFNLGDMDMGKPTIWEAMATGIEESVALDLLSPSRGVPLISAIGDYAGFVHRNLNKPAKEGNFSNPRFGNTNSLACAEKRPGIIVRAGRATGDNPGKTIGYSLNGGKSWQPVDTLPHPQACLGSVAVSADGISWIWAPEPVRGGFGAGQGGNRSRQPQIIPVYLSRDQGKSWTECQGLPGNTRVNADRVNPLKFYGLSLFDGILYISHDGGFHFSAQKLNLPGPLPAQGANRGDRRGGQDRIYATPGREGDLWIAAFDGLYHSSDTGVAFDRITDVQEIHGFGFGKAAPGSKDPALYLIGTINGLRGIFRSNNNAKTWVRINDDQHQWGLLLHITGDPKKYGRVYVGTHGRGTVYGDPQ